MKIEGDSVCNMAQYSGLIQCSMIVNYDCLSKSHSFTHKQSLFVLGFTLTDIRIFAPPIFDISLFVLSSF